MPHECTNCGLTFPNGSKEMLSGCPDCGGNKFQFRPSGGSTENGRPSPTPDSDTPDPTIEPDTADPATGNSNARSRPTSGTPSDIGPDPEGTSSSTPSDRRPAESSDPPGDAPSTDPENRAQASARRTVPEDLPRSDPRNSQHPDPSGSGTPETPSETETHSDGSETAETPDIAELREELDEQFESIKIHAPGEYELNLMELYDREEHIIALQEDGRYVIDVPGSWRETEDD